jgi:dihydrofolate reductase
MIIAILATDKNNGIGLNNSLPWHLPEDLKYFKKITSNNTIIMGRKTFESIGKALPNRRNVVITRNENWSHPDVTAYSDIMECLSKETDLSCNNTKNVYIIGGAEIYKSALQYSDQLLITRIDKEFQCDTFIPDICKDFYMVDADVHFSKGLDCYYSFLTYMRTLSTT